MSRGIIEEGTPRLRKPRVAGLNVIVNYKRI